jgi:hypothetical protein
LAKYINSNFGEPLAKPPEMLQASVAVTEKYGSGAHVPGKARGFAISSGKKDFSADDE